MAAPLLWPTELLPSPGSSWWYDWRQARTVSAAGTTKAMDLGRGIWRARLTFSRRNTRNAEAIHAFGMSLRGWINPFRMGIHYDIEQRLGSGTITCTSTGTVGTSLPTGGWSPASGLVMRKGMFIDMSTIAQEPRLQMLTEDAIAAGGAATLKISPGVEIPTGPGETVHFGRYTAASPARVTVQLVDPKAFARQFDHPVWSSLVMELEEWWPDREGL